MSIDEKGEQAALRTAFDVGTITVKDTLKILEAYEAAKDEQPVSVADVAHKTGEHPIDIKFILDAAGVKYHD